jgi:hypothetical protein
VKTTNPIAEVEMQHTLTPPGLFVSQAVPFEISTNCRVEIRVTGGDAQLWLESVHFVSRRGTSD